MGLKNDTDRVNALIDSYLIGEYYRVNKEEIDNAIKVIIKDKLENKIIAEIRHIADNRRAQLR